MDFAPSSNRLRWFDCLEFAQTSAKYNRRIDGASSLIGFFEFSPPQSRERAPRGLVPHLGKKYFQGLTYRTRNANCSAWNPLLAIPAMQRAIVRTAFRPRNSQQRLFELL
jgi:hypothetical protein